MQTINHWLSFETPEAVATAVCHEIVRQAQQSIAERGCFKLVLAGGSTPKLAYSLLVQQPVDWSKCFIFFGDERCLPIDDPDRNSVMAQQALLSHIDIPAQQVFIIPAELGNVEGAKLYEQQVIDAQTFDLVLLGMGEDGHIASLFPSHEHAETEFVHPVYNAPKPPADRITLSAKALSNSRELIFIITGMGKQAMIKQWQSGVQLPVSTIAPINGVDVYIDKAALGD